MYAGMRAKSLLLIVVAFGLGTWMLWQSVGDFQKSRQLASEGKETSATVLDKSTRLRSRGGTRYYLTVQFQNLDGQNTSEAVQVTHAEYLKAGSGTTVTLRYLASDPSVCSVGEPVPAWRSNATSGALLLLAGVVLVVLKNRFGTANVAKKVVENVAGLCEPAYEYAMVKATDFSHLDLPWYDASQRWLETQGFALLADEENLTFQRISKGNRTLLRTMVARDATWLAHLYHFKPSAPVKALGGDGFRILELQSSFANSAFVCTSNAEAAGKFDPPPGVDAAHLPACTPLETIVTTHAERVATFLANNPGVPANRFTSLEEVHRIQNVLQQIKSAHRRNTGLTKEELQRLGGSRLCQEQFDSLHADVEKLHAEQNRKAA